MDRTIRDFEKRQRAVQRKHRKLADGYTTRLNRNGVIEHQPIRRIPFLTMKGLLLVAAGFLGFKGILLANLGLEDYAIRIGHLAQGTAVEKVGAWLMGIDPATAWIASGLQTLFS